MSIIHSLQRFLGLHPQRREGEPNARSAAALVAMCRADMMYGRRHDDELTERSPDRKVSA